MHLDVINCKPKVRIFNHNAGPVKSNVLIFHFVCIKNEASRGTKGGIRVRSEIVLCRRKHANWFPTELLCNVAIARNLSSFFGSPVFRIQRIDHGRCPEMQTEIQTASNQTPVSSRRQSAPDCYKRHDLFCPETILRLNIIQTEKYCL